MIVASNSSLYNPFFQPSYAPFRLPHPAQYDIMSRKWTQRIGRNLIFPYRALLAGLSVRRRDISLLLTERIISSTQLYRWSTYNTPFHQLLATCTYSLNEYVFNYKS